MHVIKAIEEVRNGNIDSAYVLVGELDFLKHRFVNWLAKKTGASVVRIGSENLETLRDMSTLSLFEPKRVVVVELPAKKEQLEFAKKYLDPNTISGVLVIMGELKLPGAQLVQCSKLSRSDAIKWIKAEFKMRKVTCEDDEAELLYDLCGGDLWAISTEIDKLSLVAKAITRQHLETYVVGEVGSGSYFTLMDAVLDGDRKRCTDQINKLLEQGEMPQQVFVFLYRIFSLAWKARAFKKDTATLAKESGRSPYFVGKCVDLGRRIPEERLKLIITAFYDLDFRSKIGRIDSQKLFDELMQAIFGKESVLGEKN
ncbi:DNA polymerase III subunit delta [Coprothermobacteraceae bacterium]|nr:DNA polymerase III subunit delta [Coprothermobacteraceae bacterium]